jgi:V/A-type H+-transporting ATPase subunit A
MNSNNVIYSINGPVVTVNGQTDLEMMEMVFVGEKRLIGEVIRIDSDAAVIQVYEETSGLKPGDPVDGSGSPMSMFFSAPVLLSNIFDGIERSAY